jgi:hypothetical protein
VRADYQLQVFSRFWVKADYHNFFFEIPVPIGPPMSSWKSVRPTTFDYQVMPLMEPVAGGVPSPFLPQWSSIQRSGQRLLFADVQGGEGGRTKIQADTLACHKKLAGLAAFFGAIDLYWSETYSLHLAGES